MPANKVSRRNIPSKKKSPLSHNKYLMLKARVKICLIGPSGVGKSTSAQMLQNKFELKITKLARPLYEIQDFIYKKLGIKSQGQDGELLQFLGNKVQTVSPKYLSQVFLRDLNGNTVNDDCRPHNYSALKKAGFIFVYVESPQRVRKNDHSPVDRKHKIEWTKNQAKACSDYVLKNNGSLKNLAANIDELMKEILWTL